MRFYKLRAHISSELLGVTELIGDNADVTSIRMRLSFSSAHRWMLFRRLSSSQSRCFMTNLTLFCCTVLMYFELAFQTDHVMSFSRYLEVVT